MTSLSPLDWLELWNDWRHTPQQQKAVEQFRRDLLELAPNLLEAEATWQQAYRAMPSPAHPNPLPVAWENQNNNLSGMGYRECFSSSCAMLARYHGKVRNDDEYNEIRARYGDTTSSQAQLTALRSLGLNAYFRTDSNRSMLEQEIKAGRPVAVGWLHKGPAQAPYGDGHWSVVIGFTSTKAVMNDPNGEADLVNGGYVNNSDGQAIPYSWKNWLPRWEADGPGSGWMLTCSP